jgi:uncharacterized protein YgiM (DUF1202 family)
MLARPCSRVLCALGAIVCSLIVGLASPALAAPEQTTGDIVFAINRTQLHVRPGEAAPIVGHAEEGDELEVIDHQGRWLKVKTGRRVGWVTRTEVAPTKPAEPRNRSGRSGFSGKRASDAVKVTIAIDRVRGFDDPRTKARNVLELERGDVVTVIGRGHDGWVLVEHETDGVGWIPASVVGDAGRFAGDPRVAPAVARTGQGQVKAGAQSQVKAESNSVGKTEDRNEVKPEAEKAAPAAIAASSVASRPALRANLVAAGGAQTFRMQQSGEGDPMAIATGTLAAVAARAQLRVRGDLWVALATTAELGAAELVYYGASETSPGVPTRELAVDAHAELGWGDARHVALRGGVHYATLSIDSDRAESMLLGERIGGATVGVGGAMPIWRLTVSGTVDVMPVGAQRLAELPAGALYATSVRGAWARATVAMPLPAHLVAALSYRFGALTAQLTDGAATPKVASRSDQSHMVTAGVGVAW